MLILHLVKRNMLVKFKDSFKFKPAMDNLEFYCRWRWKCEELSETLYHHKKYV